jgi:hypothetical protein
MTDNEMSLESESVFRSYLDDLFRITSEIFEKEGELHPVAHLAIRMDPESGKQLDRPGIMTVMCPSLENDRAKDMWVHAIRQLCAEHHAVAAVVVNEAWMVQADPSEVDENGQMKVRPADHPKRIEVVTMMVEHAKFGTEIWSARILRDGDNASLGKFSKGFDDSNVNPTGISGRFTQFIPQRAMN